MAVRSKKASGAFTTTASTAIYTCPTGFVAKADKLTLTNDHTADAQVAPIHFGSAATAANVIIPTITVPSDDYVSPSVSNHTLTAGESVYLACSAITGLTYRLSITERTQP